MFASDRKSGTMTQGAKSGDVVVKFTGVWEGSVLHAVTGEVVSQPSGIYWEPESFTLRFVPDGKSGSYETIAEGRQYNADLTSAAEGVANLGSTPATPRASPPGTTEPKVASQGNVVENFVKGLSTNNVDAQLQFYADEVSYYEMGRVAKHAVREDLEHDIRTWPSRAYSIHDTPTIMELSSDVFQAEFPMTYTLENSKGLSSGILQMTVRFRLAGQTWQVFEIQKKPIAAQKKR
jgi:hypothetical protein